MAHCSTRWVFAVASLAWLTGLSGAAELPIFTDVTRQVGIKFKFPVSVGVHDFDFDDILGSVDTS